MSERSDYEARQAASVAADDVIARAAGETACKVIERSVCLVTSFAERADLPPGALLCRMSPEIAATLAGMGLHEPVSLRHLAGKWWVADIDAAAENHSFEPGWCMVRKVVSTEEVQQRLGGYFCQVIEGPYEPWANVRIAEAILKRVGGKYWDACISNRLNRPGFTRHSSAG